VSIDKPQFNAAQIAELSAIDLVAVHTWTSRGLVDPYKSAEDLKRGRGRARLYSLRDALAFYLMGRLHKQYRLPLPQGRKICRSIFGSGYSPAKTKFVVLSVSTSLLVATAWCSTEAELAELLLRHPLATVLNVGLIWENVSAGAQQFLADS